MPCEAQHGRTVGARSFRPSPGNEGGGRWAGLARQPMRSTRSPKGQDTALAPREPAVPPVFPRKGLGRDTNMSPQSLTTVSYTWGSIPEGNRSATSPGGPIRDWIGIPRETPRRSHENPASRRQSPASCGPARSGVRPDRESPAVRRSSRLRTNRNDHALLASSL